VLPVFAAERHPSIRPAFQGRRRGDRMDRPVWRRRATREWGRGEDEPPLFRFAVNWGDACGKVFKNGLGGLGGGGYKTANLA
jgi:hypothetical protein